MSTIEAPPAQLRLPAGTGEPTPGRSADLSSRLAGAGALGFAGFVVLQNVLRGSAPLPGADIDEVVTYHADHRAITVALMVLFVLSLVSIVSFLGGVSRRLAEGGRRGWALVGAIGAMAIVVLFAGVVATEQALSVLAASSTPAAGGAEALWSLHNSTFTVNLLFIGIALVGLSRAGIAAGITPRAFRWLAPVGLGLLALGTIAGPSIAAGDAMALFLVSTAGFVVWLAFLVTTGLRLVRSERS